MNVKIVAFSFVCFFIIFEISSARASDLGDEVNLGGTLMDLGCHIIEDKLVVHRPFDPSEIKFLLFTKNHPIEEIIIDQDRPTILANVTSKIVFIIHGWFGSTDLRWIHDLTVSFLNLKEEYYVIHVNWHHYAADLNYCEPLFHVKDVGYTIGEFLLHLNEQYSVPLENFLIVGFSLGGQVSGFIGKRVTELSNKKLRRIVALDPAGPGFTNKPETERVSENDAEIVEVVHTDVHLFGYRESCGTIDIFVNHGGVQPGCCLILGCSHMKAVKYFNAAILNPRAFIAQKCDNLSCSKVSLGDLNFEEAFCGNFHLAIL